MQANMYMTQYFLVVKCNPTLDKAQHVDWKLAIKLLQKLVVTWYLVLQ